MTDKSMDSNEINKLIRQAISENDAEQKASLDPESHLQSLGFVTENGKPRFKLDEPTTSTAMCQSAAQLNDYSIVDPNDTLSFVVLGKDSMNVIHESSMASYMNIQSKSMSVDYNSIISSLTTAEIQKKLTELLQENAMLKETLEKNNIIMKKEFNTLATWQEEVMKVHQSHKKKFEETRELISNLKKENSQLKDKLSERTESVILNETQLQEASGEKEKESAHVKELEEKVSLLTKELTTAKETCAQLTDAIRKFQNNSSITESQCTLSAKEKLDFLKKLRSGVTNTDSMETSNFTLLEPSISETKQNQKLCEECLTKNKEVENLKGKIDQLEEKLQCTFSPIQICVNEATNRPSTFERQQFIQDMKQYDEKLRELNECYLSQTTRYLNIQECLKECTDVLELIENIKSFVEIDVAFHDSWSLMQNEMGKYKEKLASCRSKLAEEQVKLISDRQCVIKAQSQFQKILANYNSVLYEMEITLEENTKLETINTNIKRESDQKISEFEKSKDKIKQILEHEKRSLTEERESLLEERRQLMEEKESLNSEKSSLDSQFKSLNDERELLQQERSSLHDEKTSLDQQSQLYETHEQALAMEKKNLEQRSARLLDEINSLNEDLQKKRMEVVGLQRQLAQQAENIELLKTQMMIYEEDFAKEREIKERLQNEKMEAQMELRRVADHNSQLERTLARYRDTKTTTRQGSDNFPQQPEQEVNLALYSCPKCEQTFSALQLLEEHVGPCLDSV